MHEFKLRELATMTRILTHHRGLRGAVSALGTAAIIATGLVGAATIASADDPRSEDIYNSIPEPQPGSYSSLGFTARSIHEVGDYVQFAGENRAAQTVTVSMTNWACESGGGATCLTTDGAHYEHPITVTFYEAGGTAENPTVGDELYSVTRDIVVPFRPSADVDYCGSGGQWNDAGTCRNGFAFDAVFDLTESGFELPDDAIISVKYPTGRFGELPSGPWDSLNVSVTSAPPTAGTNPVQLGYFANSAHAPFSGDAGADVFSYAATTGFGLVFSITAAPDTVATLPTEFLQGFEEDATGMELATRVAGTSDLRAAAGCFYATAPVTNGSTHGTDGFVVTRYNGYTTQFPDDGFFAAADFYLDADAEEGQFSWSNAVNGTDGNHQRDFIFHAGADGDGTWTIGASNNAANSAPWISDSTVEPIEITESGWYTFGTEFYAEDGLLYAQLVVIDADGNQLSSWTLGGAATDTVPASVGGNRYGWLVNNSYAALPIDNVLLNAEHPARGCETDPGSIVAEVNDWNGDNVTGGSVDVIDVEGEVVATQAVDAEGVTTFTGVDPGYYTLYYHGFADTAAQFYDGSPTWDDAEYFSLVAEESKEISVNLEPGGVITGVIANADDYEGRPALLLDFDLQAVMWANVGEDGRYTFENVPAGRYHVMILSEYGYQWILAAGVTSKPYTATLPEDDDWIVEVATKTLPTTPKSMFYGNLNAPKEWKAEAVCVSAKVGSTLASQYCGPEGSEFIMDRIPTYSSVTVTFTEAHEVPGVHGFANDGKPVYWGSSKTGKDWGVIKTHGQDFRYVPVFWFKDISGKVQGFEHVLWMGDMGISAGYADGGYKPDNKVIRKHMAIFMWNMMGHPSVNTAGKSVFKDMKTSDAGYKAVKWLADEGVTYGNGKGSFRPGDNVTREQLAVWLYNLAGKPSVTVPATSPFKDVKTTDSSYKAIVWMEQTGIAEGYKDGSFRPDVDISRKHMAFFLEKFYLWWD